MKNRFFCVNNGWYHCFGCGATGDVVKFVMEMESVSFYDAVKLLADKVGMQLPEVKLDPEYAKKKEHSDVLKQLMRDVARYYRNNLLDENKGKEAREYLHNRSLDDETAKRYGLGLSLDGESMVGYMRRKGYLLKDLEECGLIANTERPYDAFANRIIVPIMDSMSNVIAFGGRIYHGEKDVAKYKNSTNTALFDKGRTIYGVNFIKRDKKLNGIAYKELILVEGYMDVISLGASGIKNAVACMGTALTDGQARELSRMTETLYVCYDGDGAGKKQRFAMWIYSPSLCKTSELFRWTTAKTPTKPCARAEWRHLSKSKRGVACHRIQAQTLRGRKRFRLGQRARKIHTIGT